jgi:hypothetical protein
MTYHDVDQRALPDQLAFTPGGEAIVYLVLEKGVDNVGMPPLDGRVVPPDDARHEGPYLAL